MAPACRKVMKALPALYRRPDNDSKHEFREPAAVVTGSYQATPRDRAILAELEW